MNILISILVHCYDEESSLPLFYQEVRKVIDKYTVYDWKLLFVNDESQDSTIIILQL